MASYRPINARAYYDYLPESGHQCGDIWADLPCMGLFAQRKTVHGLMITPACDVTNYKSETLTYLPVLPIKEYLSTIAFLPATRRKVVERLISAKFMTNLSWPEPGYEPPSSAALSAEIARINHAIATTKIKSGDLIHLQRAIAGLNIALACSSSSVGEACIADYSLLYGSEWEVMKKQLVLNSFRPDIHFLPCDEQPKEGHTLRSHSVILFRYPISVPSEILTAAQSASPSNWRDLMNAYESVSAAASHFRDLQPLKILSLKSAFLSDMLSRFTSLYGRMGSPDFSSSTLNKYIGEI